VTQLFPYLLKITLLLDFFSSDFNRPLNKVKPALLANTILTLDFLECLSDIKHS
jgi:hypothetical protein